MNKRDLMIKAHKIAKATARIVGDYMVAMKLAMKKVWSEMMIKEVKINHRFIDYANNGARYIEVDAAEADIFEAGATLVMAGRKTEANPNARRGRRGGKTFPGCTAVIDGLGKVFERHAFGVTDKLVRVYLKDINEA